MLISWQMENPFQDVWETGSMLLLILDGGGRSIGREPSMIPVGEGLCDVSYIPPPVGDP